MRRECRKRFPRRGPQKETRKLAIPARDARAVMRVGIAKPRWWGKRSRHSRRMRNPQFYVSGKRLMPYYVRWSTGAVCGIITITNLMKHESVIIVFIIVVTRCFTLRNTAYYLLNILIPGLWCRNKHILCLEHLLWNYHLVNVTRLMITNDRKAQWCFHVYGKWKQPRPTRVPKYGS